MQNFLKKVRENKKIIALSLSLVLMVLAMVVIFNNKTTDTDLPHEAMTMFENGEKDEAIKIVESYIKDNPNDVAAKNELAMMYFQDSQYDKLIQLEDKYQLNSANFFNMLAATYQLRNEPEKSEIYYRKAIAADSTNPRVYINFSAFYQSLGKTQQALEVLEDGLGPDHKNTTLLISAASVSLKLNDTQRAQGYLKEALDIEPKNAQAQTMLSQI